MGHGKETPRQKMIGMMYLVLTAMLALNVSATVLDAFVLVDSGLSQTTRSFTFKNERLYNQIDNSYLINPTKVGPWKAITDEIREKTRVLFDYVQQLKVETVIAAENETSEALIGENQIDASKIGGKGDTNTGSRLFIGSDGSGKAYELKNKIIEYREFMNGLVDPNIAPQLAQSISTILNTDDPPPSADGTPHTWESTRFDHIPLVAIFPQLTKIQLDVLNVEAEVVAYLLQQIDAGDFKVNKLDAVVIPNSNYVIEGNEFSAEIFLAASDTTQVPVIYIGSYESFRTDKGVMDFRMRGSYQEIPVVGGIGIFKQRATRLGKNQWSGLIEVTAPDGSKIRKPFNHEFEVAAPSVVISPTRMNVFYLGVDNPVEISIPGVSMEKISATINRGSIRREGSGFIVNPGQGNNCEITVFAEIDGSKRNMGTRLFRIKRVPPPIPSVQGVTGRSVEKNILAAALSMQAQMPPDFDFDMRFTITGFRVSATIGGFLQESASRSQLFTDEQRRLINNLRAGQVVNITDIKAVGPDGSSMDLNDLVLRIQ